jgi:hypothetical protein
MTKTAAINQERNSFDMKPPWIHRKAALKHKARIPWLTKAPVSTHPPQHRRETVSGNSRIARRNQGGCGFWPEIDAGGHVSTRLLIAIRLSSVAVAPGPVFFLFAGGQVPELSVFIAVVFS